jgi:hypothetical protein
MINSGYIHKKLRSSGGVLARLMKEKSDNRELVTELYLSTLSRFPTDDELETAEAYIVESPKRRAGTEDLLWALISSRAFVFVQ